MGEELGVGIPFQLTFSTKWVLSEEDRQRAREAEDAAAAAGEDVVQEGINIGDAKVSNGGEKKKKG